jgi:hypothetical protein
LIIENLTVGRVVLHEVFQRKDGPNVVQPAYGQELEVLDQVALSHFEMRITDALSARSKSIEMRVVKTDAASVLGAARDLVRSSDGQFAATSARIADALADAQKSRGIPGGMLLVFDGHIGADSLPFVGVIKAEMQSGFRRQATAAKVVTEFLENIFLTPATRLYKLALFVAEYVPISDETKWKCFVFDSNITATRRENAALYFYDGFLGCAFPENGKYETSRFFDLTRDFMREIVTDRELKRDLGDALYTFVKVEQSPTFTSQEFGDAYLPVELRDPFKRYLDAKKFPTNRAIVRDTSDMGGRLRRRKFKFGADIDFSASPEAIRDKTVVIEEMRAPRDTSANNEAAEGETWTTITIRRPMTDQL